MEEMGIYLYGEVGYEITEEGVRGTLNYLKQNEELDVLHVRMFSPGGDPGVAYRIAELFNNYGKDTGTKRVFVNDGYNASAGMVIMLESSDEILALPYSQLLVHRAWGRVEGDSIKVKEFGDELESYTEPHIEILMKRLGMVRESVEALLDENRWMSLSEAREIGLVDGVHEGVIDINLAHEVIERIQERSTISSQELGVVKQLVADEVKRQEILKQLESA